MLASSPFILASSLIAKAGIWLSTDTLNLISHTIKKIAVAGIEKMVEKPWYGFIAFYF